MKNDKVKVLIEPKRQLIYEARGSDLLTVKEAELWMIRNDEGKKCWCLFYWPENLFSDGTSFTSRGHVTGPGCVFIPSESYCLSHDLLWWNWSFPIISFTDTSLNFKPGVRKVTVPEIQMWVSTKVPSDFYCF